MAISPGFVIIIIILSILLILAVILIIVRYRNRHGHSESYDNAVKVLSDMYSSLTLIDLENGMVKPLRHTDIDTNVFKEKTQLINSKERVLAAHLAAQPFRESLYQFIRMDKIQEHMGNMSHITHEYVDNDHKWNRLHFIVAERDSYGAVAKLLWAVESIDEDKKRQAQFKNLAETDPLTKLLNRSGGESVISELLLAGKHGMILMIDIDNFKYVNDTYGKEKGDEVIATLANVLKDTFRETDVLFRQGGDKFVVFIPGVDDISSGQIAIDRLFNNVDKVSLENTADWKMRLSVGAVLCREQDRDAISVLYQTADMAMRESKHREGNYVTFAKKDTK